jgi:hypothetical protein
MGLSAGFCNALLPNQLQQHGTTQRNFKSLPYPVGDRIAKNYIYIYGIYIYIYTKHKPRPPKLYILGIELKKIGSPQWSTARKNLISRYLDKLLSIIETALDHESGDLVGSFNEKPEVKNLTLLSVQPIVCTILILTNHLE